MVMQILKFGCLLSARCCRLDAGSCLFGCVTLSLIVFCQIHAIFRATCAMIFIRSFRQVHPTSLCSFISARSFYWPASVFSVQKPQFNLIWQRTGSYGVLFHAGITGRPAHFLFRSPFPLKLLAEFHRNWILITFASYIYVNDLIVRGINSGRPLYGSVSVLFVASCIYRVFNELALFSTATLSSLLLNVSVFVGIEWVVTCFCVLLSCLLRFC